MAANMGFGKTGHQQVRRALIENIQDDPFAGADPLAKPDLCRGQFLDRLQGGIIVAKGVA